MASDIVKNWFGDKFSTLAPELQRLHTHGGVLVGDVNVSVGRGISGAIGRRLSRKLNLPPAGSNQLAVTISHSDSALHWDRNFNNSTEMKSTFYPVGTINDGYWIEKTGPLHMKLTVDIKNSGWYWRCLGFKLFGLPLPVWLFPESQAYKYIDNGYYKFFVGFTAPIVGQLVSYSGELEEASLHYS